MIWPIILQPLIHSGTIAIAIPQDQSVSINFCRKQPFSTISPLTLLHQIMYLNTLSNSSKRQQIHLRSFTSLCRSSFQVLAKHWLKYTCYICTSHHGPNRFPCLFKVSCHYATHNQLDPNENMILHIEKLSPLSNRLTETCQAALHTLVEAALLELNLSSTWNVHYQCSCWFLSFLAQWGDRGIRGELLTRNSTTFIHRLPSVLYLS